MRGPNGAHTCGFYRPCIIERLAIGCSKALRCLQGPALHLKEHLPKPGGYTYGFMLYWAKYHKNTQRTGERMWPLHHRRLISYGLNMDHRLPWLPKTYKLGHTRWSRACDLSFIYFMPRSHEALGQSTGPVRAKLCKHMENHTACIAIPHDVSKNFELCHGWRLSIYTFQTWATSDFVPIEGQLW